MATANGRENSSLSDRLFREPYAFDFFQAVRVLERRAREDPLCPSFPVGQDQPPEQEEQVEPERVGQHDLYDGHCSALSVQPMAGRPLRGRRVVSFVTGCLTLVEEPSFRHPRLVLGRDLDVRR